MKIKESILAKAVEKVQREKDFDNYIEVCLKAELCPSCGNNLTKEAIGTAHPPLVRFDCLSCGFSKKSGEKIKFDFEPELKGKPVEVVIKDSKKEKKKDE